MNAVEFDRYVQDPETIPAEAVGELKEIVRSYPFFQAALLLYLKVLWKTESADFAKELERVAISVPDRRLLYVLLKGDEVLSDPTADVRGNRDSFDLINAFLGESKEPEWHDDGKSIRELLHYDVPAASEDYLQGQSPEEMDSSNSSKLKHQDLIDSFLENNPAEAKIELPQNEEGAKEAEGFILEADNEIAVKPLDKSYFTETLARIYVKQKRYDKALQIIKNLSLKYPEKNVYFADQMRFLEKLIINTKK